MSAAGVAIVGADGQILAGLHKQYTDLCGGSMMHEYRILIFTCCAGRVQLPYF